MTSATPASAATPANTPAAAHATVVAASPSPPAQSTPAQSTPPVQSTPAAQTPAAPPAVDWVSKLKEAKLKGTEASSTATRIEGEYATASTRLTQAITGLDEALRGLEAVSEKRDASRSAVTTWETLIATLTTLVESSTLDAQLLAANERVQKASASSDGKLLEAAKGVVDVLTRKLAERDAARAAYQKAEAELGALAQAKTERERKAELEKKLTEASAKLSSLEASRNKAESDLEQGKKAVAELNALLEGSAPAAKA